MSLVSCLHQDELPYYTAFDQMPSFSTSSSLSSDNVVFDAPNVGSTFPTTLSFGPYSSVMYHELERLKTYSNWPLSYMDPRAMAKAGFYYTKRDDIVKCPFCDLEVTRWEDGDDPREDHRKWNPACRFINNPEGCGNVPLPSDFSGVITPQIPVRIGHDTCGPRALSGVDLVEDNKIRGSTVGSVTSAPIFQTKTPSFPEFSSLEARQQSYALWPVSIKVKPNVLSEAGFYYTGKGDQTICFYCGGGLKDWEDSDDPWTEHAKWFSKCTYVLLNKGEKFVENAKASITSHQNKQNDDGIKSVRDDHASIAPLLETKECENKDAGSSSSGVSGTEGNRNMENDGTLCKVCYSRGLEVVFLPCGHLVSCIQCSVQMKTCGICRKPIESVLRTFLS